MKIISFYNAIHILPILYPTSLASLVVEVGTMHNHPILLNLSVENGPKQPFSVKMGNYAKIVSRDAKWKYIWEKNTFNTSVNRLCLIVLARLLPKTGFKTITKWWCHGKTSRNTKKCRVQNQKYFLALQSGRLSVRLWHLFNNVPLIVSSWNFQELLPLTKMMSMQEVKVRSQRSRSQRSKPNLAVAGL